MNIALIVVVLVSLLFAAAVAVRHLVLVVRNDGYGSHRSAPDDDRLARLLRGTPDRPAVYEVSGSLPETRRHHLV